MDHMYSVIYKTHLTVASQLLYMTVDSTGKHSVGRCFHVSKTAQISDVTSGSLKNEASRAIPEIRLHYRFPVMLYINTAARLQCCSLEFYQ